MHRSLEVLGLQATKEPTTHIVLLLGEREKPKEGG